FDQIFDHVKVRVLAFSDPWTYIDKQGYQITQSLFAIGSGKWLGTGLLKGNPKAIPFVDADFVFSSICEELGSIIGICIILICLCSFFMIMAIASKMKDNFYRLVSFGIGIMYIFQIFLTIGGGIKFIPLTGVTLPLISYGGSSVMTTMIMYFIVQGIYIKECSMEKMEEIELAPEESFKNVKRKKDKKEQEEQATQNNLVENLSNIVLKQKKSPVIVSGFMFTVLFASMVGYLCNFVKNDQEEMLNNTYNSRQQLLAVRNYRGTIFSADGDALAETVLDSNNKEWRYYPYKNLFAHVVGFSTNGKMGVEAMANYYLINTHESIPNRVANSMAGRKNLGDNVYTTLDVNLQKIADDQLSLYKGSVIVTEVKTGKILAMVSHPDFNPNEIEKIWDGLIEDENSTVLVNRTTQGLYPPGSTFKILTALEYIRENPEDYLNYQYDCSGTYTNGNNKISCYHKSVHHTVDFMKSFAKSCNSSFANIGMSLDRENFKSTLEGLYFGKELPISLKCALSQYNLPLSGGDSEVMQTAIGQGKTLITPMQMHLITSAIANDGVLIKPYLLEKVESTEGELIKKFETEKIQTTITKEEANILKELMAMVVTEGTASKLSDLDFSAAGKTGSAEYSNVKGESHAWFTGFAPADNPEICVTIIVEGAGSGGDYAVPIAKQIFQEYFNR
ncbi:MAG: FtsW/RodA/SpoVE family cell cycle protein, partial [bacterium]|nr:FtsW/RodA/SpoVE family cell cycle protein [bacterium]